MAERRSHFDRTTVTTSPTDPLRRRVVQSANIGSVTSDVDAARKARQRMPKSHTVDGVVVPLFSISTTRYREDAAMVQALYAVQPNGDNRSQGFNRFRISMGYETVEWVRTSVDANGKPAFEGGIPVGVVNRRAEADGGKVVHPYLLTIPVWRISVSTVLKFNPAGQVAAYNIAPLNKTRVVWNNIPFGKYTLRFDSCVVDWADGDLFAVDYQFTARMGGHYRQVITDDEYDPVNALVGEPRSYTSPGFPVAKD